MKQVICLLLLLSLLLTACSGNTSSSQGSADAPSESTGDTATQATQSPAESDPAQSDPTGAEGSADSESPTASDPTGSDSSTEPESPTEAYKPSGSVSVDFSVYTQEESAPLSPLYTLPGQEDQLPFARPRAIYPYAGSVLRTEYGSYEGNLYGFTDSTGILITPPLYNTVYVLRDYDRNISLPYWVVERAEKDTHQWEDGSTYDYPRWKMGLVAMDGTLVLDCIYDNICLNDDRILCSLDSSTTGGTPILEAYDAEGKLRFSTKDYSFGATLSSPYCSYGEGLYVLSFPDTAPDADEYDTSSYFVTETGEFLFGPYRSALPFYDGIAMVSLGINEDTYLRRDGTMFPETYAYADSFRNGFALITNEQWNNGLIDTNGTVYIAPTGSISRTENGGYLAWGYEDGVSLPTRCYDENCNFLWESEMEWANIFSDDILYNTTYDTTTLTSVSTGKTLTLPIDSFGEYVHHATDPYVVLHSLGSETGFYTHYIVTYDLEVFAEVTSSNANLKEAVNIIGENGCGFSLREGNRVTLYESPKNPMGTYEVPKFLNATLFPDGTVSFTWEGHTELYDKEGNLFLRYVFATMDD